MNLKWNKQNNFAVEFISLNYSIMYLFFLFLNLSTNVSRSLSDSLSFPSMDILIRASKFLMLNECWMIFIQLCAVGNKRWTQWFRFTTFNKSSNTISIVAASFTFDFTNVDFTIIFIGFLLFHCHKKKNQLTVFVFPLSTLFFSGNIYCCETCLCQKRTTTGCAKNCDEKRIDDRICNREI